jgi:hypothetical protein
MASGIGIDEVCISNSILNNLQQILNPAIQRHHDLGCQIQRKWGYIQLGLVEGDKVTKIVIYSFISLFTFKRLFSMSNHDLPLLAVAFLQ